MSFFIQGIGVSKGYGIGQVHLLERNRLKVNESLVPDNLINNEIINLKNAIQKTYEDIESIKVNLDEDHQEISAFLDSHLLMLQDPSISKNPIKLIKQENYTAIWALEVQKNKLIGVFEQMDDIYLSSRKDDINQVIQKIQVQLNQTSEPKEKKTYSLKSKIVVADDLTPADTIEMQNQGVVGFITESGGPLSHTAILSRSLGIPAIVGVHHARSILNDQEDLIIDGFRGNALVNPERNALKHYKKLLRKSILKKKELEKLAQKPTVSLDGKRISLQANIETPRDIKAIKKFNIDGIGLYRTEFLYMNRTDLPTEEEHFKTYTKIIRALKGSPLTIRTVDLGADKELEDFSKISPLAHNPALGLRGIRLALNNPNIFIPQLKAILRSSSKGPVKILLPMVTTLDEVLQTKIIIKELKESLKKKGYKFAKYIPIGVMIEVPSSAILSDQFAKNVDFLSIGTNDLVQYTLAIDRLDDEVNYLYNPLEPSVLQLIKNVIDSGIKYGIEVSMCGEMAGEIKLSKLLLGMGLSNFSIQHNNFLEIKDLILKTEISPLKEKVSGFYSTENITMQEKLLQQL